MRLALVCIPTIIFFCGWNISLETILIDLEIRIDVAATLLRSLCAELLCCVWLNEFVRVWSRTWTIAYILFRVVHFVRGPVPTLRGCTNYWRCIILVLLFRKMVLRRRRRTVSIFLIYHSLWKVHLVECVSLSDDFSRFLGYKASGWIIASFFIRSIITFFILKDSWRSDSITLELLFTAWRQWMSTTREAGIFCQTKLILFALDTLIKVWRGTARIFLMGYINFGLRQTKSWWQISNFWTISPDIGRYS